AWLGVYTQSVDKNMAEAFELSVDYGAIVNSIVDDSPADRAGLEEDDIIIAINGERVADDEALIKMVRNARPGDDVVFTVMRGDREREIDVELGRRGDHRSKSWGPRTYTYSYNYDDDDWDGDWDEHWGKHRDRHSHGYLGVYLTDLSPEAAQALGAERGGVLVNEVEEDSPADNAGIRAGDIIVSINDESIRDADDLTDIVRDMKEGDMAKVAVIRSGDDETIEVSVRERTGGMWFAGPQRITIPPIPPIPPIPDIDVDFDSDEFNREWREAMRELRHEMQELRHELKDIERRVD
ncbi:PDZ domain-containing protein, partial [candidate division GN15 bacterium]|nr:PDZ domain-containing protein [candidate division GN15 bacterium]